MGNRQFQGAMATADWYNRLLSYRKRRGVERRDEQSERATGKRGEVEMEMRGR